jgi:hypothetical protein
MAKKPKKKQPPEAIFIVRPHSDPEKRAATGCAPFLMMTSLAVALVVKVARR